MKAFGDDVGLKIAGLDLGGDVLRVPRKALYKFAAKTMKGLGNSAGAGLPGQPNYHATTFGCTEQGCRQTRTRFGHRTSDPPPTCPDHFWVKMVPK
jgi:hypothetical protein